MAILKDTEMFTDGTLTRALINQLDEKETEFYDKWYSYKSFVDEMRYVIGQYGEITLDEYNGIIAWYEHGNIYPKESIKLIREGNRPRAI